METAYSEAELIVLISSVILGGGFLRSWIVGLSKPWRPRPRWSLLIAGWLLPLAALAAMLFTLINLASFDVVDSSMYIIFYVALGVFFIYFGLSLMSPVLDLSWKQDMMLNDNPAALAAVSGGYLGLTAIYCGANIGDGPGWWCVVFAGGLGLAAWLALGWVLARGARTFERITIDRDLSCGLRTGAYLLASGLILGRASAGDWTSFEATVVEFRDGLPVLLLTALALSVDRFIRHNEPAGPGQADYQGEGGLFPAGAVFWAMFYLILALCQLFLMPPLSHNPLY